MRPTLCFTLNELQRLVPSFRKEAIKDERPEVKKAIFVMFWRLGADCTHGVEVQEGLVSRNRFNEEDSSPRFMIAERSDKEWLTSVHASKEAKQYTEDPTLLIALWRLKNGGSST